MNSKRPLWKMLAEGRTLQECCDEGHSPISLIRIGKFQIKEIQRHLDLSTSKLIRIGVTLEELVAAGYSWKQVKKSAKNAAKIEKKRLNERVSEEIKQHEESLDLERNALQTKKY